MSKCLILDDDELCVPIAPGPIDAYRGRCKEVEYVRSSVCKYGCISNQNGNSCSCADRVSKSYIILNELREEMNKYDEDTRVSFGKYKGYRWRGMFSDREVKSWSVWYLKNANKKEDEFYKYLTLLNQYYSLENSIRYTENPNYD